MRMVLVSQISPRQARQLQKYPLFRNTRFRQPGRLLTLAEVEARQKAQQPAQQQHGFSSAEISESYAEELAMMRTVAHSYVTMLASRRYRLRKIRNHSGAMSRRRSQ